MGQFTKIIASSLRHGNPQDEQVSSVNEPYHKLSPLSTSDEISCRLLHDIETIADGSADEDASTVSSAFPNQFHAVRIEKLYKETLFLIRDSTSSRRDVADKMSHALQMLSFKITNQLDGLRMDIIAEMKRSEHPPIVASIVDKEQELSEIKEMTASNPKLLEDVIETEVHQVKRSRPLFGLSLRMRDKIVVTQKAVPSHIMRRYNECQERLLVEKEKLYHVEKQVEEVTCQDNYEPAKQGPRLALFARKYHYRVLALRKLRVLHNHRNPQQQQS